MQGTSRSKATLLEHWILPSLSLQGTDTKPANCMRQRLFSLQYTPFLNEDGCRTVPFIQEADAEN